MSGWTKFVLVVGYLTIINTVALVALIFGNAAIAWLEKRLKGGDKV